MAFRLFTVNPLPRLRVSVRRLGDGLYLEPIKDAGWPKDYFRKIRIQDRAFARPDQGKLPLVPSFGA